MLALLFTSCVISHLQNIISSPATVLWTHVKSSKQKPNLTLLTTHCYQPAPNHHPLSPAPLQQAPDRSPASVLIPLQPILHSAAKVCFSNCQSDQSTVLHKSSSGFPSHLADLWVCSCSPCTSHPDQLTECFLSLFSITTQYYFPWNRYHSL